MTTTSPPPVEITTARHLSQWRVNILRVGYLVMGVGLVVVKWPKLAERGSWTLEEGTIECLLVAMSVLALLGLRHPVRMLPILVFEVAWKLLWLGLVALPAWLAGDLDGETRTQAGSVLWVVVVIAVLPWDLVVRRFVTAPGQRFLSKQPSAPRFSNTRIEQ